MSLHARQIAFDYSSPRRASHGAGVLTDVTFAPQSGQMTAIAGPNGSGKSTLLRLLLGSRSPAAGEIELDGRPMNRWSASERARRIAYIAQRPDTVFGYTAREVISLGRLSLGCPASEDRRAVDRAIETMELGELAAKPVTTLSIGEQQRTAIARAIAQLDQPGAQHTRVLLADEPASALDPRHAIRAMQAMKTLASSGDIAVILVLHDLQAAARWADEGLILQEGRVVAHGPADEIFTPGVLSGVFDVPFAAPAEGVLMPMADDAVKAPAMERDG